MTTVTVTWQNDSKHSRPSTEFFEFRNVSGSTEVEESVSEDVSEGTSRNDPGLIKLEREMGVVVLDECLQKLFVLQSILNEAIRASWLDVFQYRSLDEKLNNQTTPQRFQEFAEEEYEKFPYGERHKCQKDLCFLTRTIEETLKEIYHGGTFAALNKILLVTKRENEEMQEIIMSVQKSEALLTQMQNFLIRERETIFQVLDERSAYLASLKVEFEDIIGYEKTELNYVTNWENARKSQHETNLRRTEDVFNSVIAGYMREMKYETRIHDEIADFLEENSTDLRGEIKYWVERYDVDLETHEAELFRLRMTQERLKDDYGKLKELYVDHKEFIREWLETKEEKRARAELEKKQLWAARKIQRWWRRILSMRPSKKKKNKSKQKKKGKK